MLEALKKEVCEANLMLPALKLVTFTWGNVSGIDRESGIVAIKPSGVPYEELTPDKIVLVDLEGKVVEGDLNPSSDLKTHLVLYKQFADIGGVVHTHSTFATSFAQAKMAVPALGTTHADAFCGPVPCTRPLTAEEVGGDYEKSTGGVIVETVKEIYESIPAVLAACHGPFAWGKTPAKAVENIAVLEETAKMALYTMQLNPSITPVKNYLLDKHYLRKHGANAYYGQK
ncbi:MAG: L-ribulose-5-phosphate 4-epimerase [Clostridia bacterium]|nr:L-ribulose-5-phosphate 4-epimerase [Clostridia bacterium]